jgi:ABC-type Na+ transport system ATPase subunit NatA
MMNDLANQYIDARIAELTRLREAYDKTDRHYYALSAGIYELLIMQQHLSKVH